MDAAKTRIVNWIEENRKEFTDMADSIWENPEQRWKEFHAAHIQAEYLANEGFTVTKDISGMNTAFIAEWGEGKPVIGFIGEYDALPGLSQKAISRQEPVIENGPGHGCGHNLLGTGAVAAAVAVQKWLQESGTTGTVRYYGCPAEEGGGGKVFMAREGIYDDLDAAFNFHPGETNMPMKGGCVAVNMIAFKFRGLAAHAAYAHNGRSALDAVELMNVGVNYLREHVKDSVRIHYVITNGGEAPNIVPEEAEVLYIVRAETTAYLREVTNRVRRVAEGATIMTDTTVSEEFIMGYSTLINNHRLADLQYKAMEEIGPIDFSADELKFAQEINDALPGSNSDHIDSWIEKYNLSQEICERLEKYRHQALVDENFPAYDQNHIDKGATDVGDLGQITPVSLLMTSCFTTGSPGHNWGNVATAGMSIGHKGMLHAAKIMALAAVDLYSSPTELQHVRAEFEKNAKPYICPMPEENKPPRFEPVT